MAESQIPVVNALNNVIVALSDLSDADRNTVIEWATQYFANNGQVPAAKVAQAAPAKKQAAAPKRRATKAASKPKNEFAKNLAKLRKKAGITRTALADKSGVNVNSLVGYEKGSYRPRNAEVYAKIAGALGCKPEDLNPELKNSADTKKPVAKDKPAAANARPAAGPKA